MKILTSIMLILMTILVTSSFLVRHSIRGRNFSCNWKIQMEDGRKLDIYEPGKYINHGPGQECADDPIRMAEVDYGDLRNHIVGYIKVNRWGTEIGYVPPCKGK